MSHRPPAGAAAHSRNDPLATQPASLENPEEELEEKSVRAAGNNEGDDEEYDSEEYDATQPISEALWEGYTLPVGFLVEDKGGEAYSVRSSNWIVNKEFKEGRHKSAAGVGAQRYDATSSGLSQDRGQLICPPADVIVRGGVFYRNLLTNTWLPWLFDYNPWVTGFTTNEYAHALYDCSALEAVIVPPPVQDVRELHFIDLFFQHRYFGRPDNRVNHKPEDLLESWNFFVGRMAHDPTTEVEIIRRSKQQYYNNTFEGAKMKVHELCTEERLPCGVIRGDDCPMCYKGGRRLPSGVRKDMNNYVPSFVIKAIMELDTFRAKHERDQQDRDAERILLSRNVLTEANFSVQDFLTVSAHSINALSMAQRACLEIKDIRYTFDVMNKDRDQMQTQIEELKDEVTFYKNANANLVKTTRAKRKRSRAKK